MVRAARPQTGFDAFVEAQMDDPEFVAAYRDARREVDATDRLVRTLDATRIRRGYSKARLAKLIDAKPEIVRRLFTAEAPNPTLATFAKVAAALGLRIELVPAGTTPSAAKRPSSSRRAPASRRAAPAR
ncbi:MAG: XRE family transcriptional regulator [Deltaproteobacteria bacterium]|nr:XRE family transcriptional regulator [Deltaproteobacteria bacterium]